MAAEPQPPFFYGLEIHLFLSHVDCLLATVVFRHVEGDLVVVPDFVDQSAHVNEHILVGFVIDDESETFPLIVEFYFAC